MKHIFVLLITLLAVSYAQADVGVSVNIGQPGFYGQIDIGDFAPQPQIIYAQPVIIRQVAVRPAPIYLHVPPGHAKNWSKHCSRYNACGRPVYFVQDSWYNDVYSPKYREYRERGGPDHHDRSHDYHGPKGKKHGNGKGKGHDKH